MYSLLDAAISNRSNLTCLGDLNCDILHPLEDGKEGRGWLDICDIYDLQNLLCEPTRISRTRESCLDLIATNAPVFALHSGTLEAGSSDHKLVYTVLNRKAMKPKTVFVKRRCFKNFDKEAFKKDLDNVPFEAAYIFDDTSDVCWAWETMYKSVLDNHARMKSQKRRPASGQSKFNTPELRKAIRKINSLIRKFNKSRSADDWEAYRTLRNRIVAMRRKSIGIVHHFDRLCSSRAGNPREFWKSLRPLMLTKNRVPEEFITLKEERTFVTEQDQVAETFNDYFTNITKSLISHKHCAFKDQVHVSQIPKPQNGSLNTFSFDRTNQHIVKDVLDNIKPNKAPGYDSIPPQAVKASSKSIAKPLSDLINIIITRSQVPDTWKHGQITPLHKKDSVLYKANFSRPVTVLPVFAKVFERVIHLQLSKHFETIFHDFMFAYRKHHACPLHS